MKRIACERRHYSALAQTHAHAYSQLIVPISGVLSVSIAEAQCNREAVLYIPPNTAHSFSATTKNEFFVLDIPSFYVPNEVSDDFQILPFNEQWQAIRSLLFEEASAKPTSSQRLANLFRYISGLLEKPQQLISLDYIHENYMQPLTIEQLAAIEHFNPTYYVSWFKKQMGVSPNAYLRKVRLARAKELLHDTDFPLLQIAQQVGYENQGTLSKLFRQEFGATPSSFRKTENQPNKN